MRKIVEKTSLEKLKNPKMRKGRKQEVETLKTREAPPTRYPLSTFSFFTASKLKWNQFNLSDQVITDKRFSRTSERSGSKIFFSTALVKLQLE